MTCYTISMELLNQMKKRRERNAAPFGAGFYLSLLEILNEKKMEGGKKMLEILKVFQCSRNHFFPQRSSIAHSPFRDETQISISLRVSLENVKKPMSNVKSKCSMNDIHLSFSTIVIFLGPPMPWQLASNPSQLTLRPSQLFLDG